MTTFKNWCGFSAAAILLAVKSPACLGQDLTTQLSAQAIHPGERLILELRLPSALSQPSTRDEEPELPVVQDDLLTGDARLQILDKDYRREKDTLIWKYQFTTYQLGKLYIPPMEVKLGPHTYSTEAMSVDVTTTRSAEDQALREEFGPVRLPFHWEIALRILLGLAFLLGLYALWRRYSHLLDKPKPLRAAIASAPEIDPLEWLKGQFAILKTKISEERASGQIVDELTACLREYYARVRREPVQAWTTHEFRLRLKSDEKAAALSLVLERCDVFKFTGATSGSPREVAGSELQESERILLLCGT